MSHVDLDGLGLYSEDDPDDVPSLATVLPALPAPRAERFAARCGGRAAARDLPQRISLSMEVDDA